MSTEVEFEHVDSRLLRLILSQHEPFDGLELPPVPSYDSLTKTFFKVVPNVLKKF